LPEKFAPKDRGSDATRAVAASRTPMTSLIGWRTLDDVVDLLVVLHILWRLSNVKHPG